MDRRRRIWHIRNIEARFKASVKRTMSSTTSEEDSRDASALLEKLQNNIITENVAMELEGTFLANPNSSRLTSCCSTPVDLQRTWLNTSVETGELETECR